MKIKKKFKNMDSEHRLYAHWRVQGIAPVVKANTKFGEILIGDGGPYYDSKKNEDLKGEGYYITAWAIKQKTVKGYQPLYISELERWRKGWDEKTFKTKRVDKALKVAESFLIEAIKKVKDKYGNEQDGWLKA